MKILALEFSSPQRSVAVVNGNRVAACEVIETTPGKTMRPFAMIESVLRQTGIEREQIECVVVGLGPGSYTGIRAAIALAQGWQLAREVKLLGVSSAECVAAQAQAEGVRVNCNVVIDAQRGEFYLATWELSDAGQRNLEPLHIVSADEARSRASSGECIIGPEVTRWFPAGKIIFPRAATLAKLALDRTEVGSGASLEPIYLRETTFVKAPAPRVV